MISVRLIYRPISWPPLQTGQIREATGRHFQIYRRTDRGKLKKMKSMSLQYVFGVFLAAFLRAGCSNSDSDAPSPVPEPAIL